RSAEQARAGAVAGDVRASEEEVSGTEGAQASSSGASSSGTAGAQGRDETGGGDGSAGREEERVAKAPSASADGGGRAPVNPAPPSGWDLEASARAGERDRERLAAMSDCGGGRVGRGGAAVDARHPEAGG